MSFNGINFANQRIVPSDDGRLYQKIFNDGALYGCTVTYSGSTLIIDAGYLIIGGRQMELTDAESFTINEAVSGYAQVIISIDLTKTATIDAFSQIDFDIRYSPTREGFPTLIQEDINGSGSRYEAKLAMVALGTGGIISVVEDIPQAAFKGSGLNFSVFTGLNPPETPSENTIWVNTDSEITKWIVDSVEPSEPVEGLVWFRLSSQASVDINLIKKNEIILRIYQPKQYIGGAWVTKTASVYQYGEWNPLRIYVYNEGKVNTLVTTSINGTLEDQRIKYTKEVTNASGNDSFTTTDPVDLTGYSAMKIRFMSTSTINGNYFRAIVTTEEKDGDNVTASGTVTNTLSSSPFNSEERTVSVDISNLSGNYYLGYSWGRLSSAADGTATLTGYIYEWWLE